MLKKISPSSDFPQLQRVRNKENEINRNFVAYYQKTPTQVGKWVNVKNRKERENNLEI